LQIIFIQFRDAIFLCVSIRYVNANLKKVRYDVIAIPGDYWY